MITPQKPLQPLMYPEACILSADAALKSVSNSVIVIIRQVLRGRNAMLTEHVAYQGNYWEH